MLEQLKTYMYLVANALLSFLPNSPFLSISSYIAGNPYLGIINYFIPIGLMISIAEAWLVCIAIFYAYQVIMRFVNLID